MRVEHARVKVEKQNVEWYVNCALVNILPPDSSTKSGTPKGFAKFPGTYTMEDPGESPPKFLPLTQSGVA